MSVETLTTKPRADVPVRAVSQTTDHIGEMGTTSISDAVVAKIAGLAAREVDGVHKLVTSGVMASVAGFAQRLTRADQRGSGVVVEVGQKEAAIDMALEIDYGVEIRRVCDAVRRTVASRVESMTGLRVKEVNILVADLYFPGEEPTSNRRVE